MAEYIEREAAYELARTSDYYSDFHRSMADLTSLKELLDDTPAADVVEVRHGYWIIIEELLETIRECSCCHCKTYFPKSMIFNLRKSLYCEDCGAKMDRRSD